MSGLKREDILNIATLARLEIPDSNLEKFAREFNDILGYVEKLNQLNTKGIEPTSQVVATQGTPFRSDTPHPSFSKEEVVQNAPEKQDEFFKVPRMIGEG